MKPKASLSDRLSKIEKRLTALEKAPAPRKAAPKKNATRY